MHVIVHETFSLVNNMAKVLVFDIETAPILAYVWKIFDENVGLNQIKEDWYILSWAAKWLGDPPSKIMYQDQRNEKNIEDDSKLLKGIWSLLDEADVVITQNGKRFDVKKLNARFLINRMTPPSPFKHIDTCQIAKQYFGFTSNKLEHLSNRLNKKYKKLRHNKFDGFELWKECLARNPDAWKEMEKYNKHDVLALEELYERMRPWDTSVNLAIYSETSKERALCSCGGRFESKGWTYTSVGKYRRYKCVKCGAHTRDSKNLFDKIDRNGIKRRIT